MKISPQNLFRRMLICWIMLMVSLPLLAQVENTIANGNARIHYRVFGKGQPILIINGGPGMNSDGFGALAEQFGGHYQAIIYDQRGTGNSTVDVVDSTTITMDAMVQDMEVLRKHLGFSKWHVLGQSFGGMLASYYATQYPRSIDKMILCASGGIDLELMKDVSEKMTARLSPAERDSLAYWNAKIADGDTSYHARLQRGMAMAPAYVVNRDHIPKIARRLTQGNAVVNGLVWQDLQKIQFDCAPALAKFRHPVLILQGREDILNENIALKAQQTLPNAHLVWLDRCAHYAWLDRPDVFWPEVDAFLK